MVGKKIPGTPPVEIDLRQQRGLYLHSWWGDTAIAVGTPSEFNEEARAQGLLAGEFVAAAMPFHGAPDEPPWGILRLGIYVKRCRKWIAEATDRRSARFFGEAMSKCYTPL